MNPAVSLSQEQRHRYARHLSLGEVGEVGQLRLASASVLVVGAGGLGCPALQFLAAAGVGRIGIVDFDRIELSNLQRQVLFTTGDIGRKKAEVASERLRAMNPTIDVRTHDERLVAANSLSLLRSYEIVIDGTDNFPAKYVINDACCLAGVPFVYGSISEFEGQIAVFNAGNGAVDQGANYRDLFPEPPPSELSRSCAEGGVLGVLPGLIGSLQANEALKLILGIGEPLKSKLLCVDALSLSFQTFQIHRRASNPLSGDAPMIKVPVDIEYSCAVQVSSDDGISVAQLNVLRDGGTLVELIDVRDRHEHMEFSMGGRCIPLAELDHGMDSIDTSGPIVFYCKSGIRSQRALAMYKARGGGARCFSLLGGIDAYRAGLAQEC